MTRAVPVVVCLLFLSGCGDEPPPAEPVAAAAPVADTRPVLRFGVISRYNPILMYRLYQPLVDYLSARTPYRVELALGKTYRDAVQFLGDGRTDIAYLGGVTYLMARVQFGAVPLVRPLNPEGEPTYRGVFVVRDDSPVRGLADLRGRSLALGSGYSTAGNLVPRLELAAAGLELSDLARFDYLPHEELVARQVLAGRYDAGALKDVVARHYLNGGLRILHASRPIPSMPITVRPDLPDSVAAALVQALVALRPGDLPGTGGGAGREVEYRYGFAPASDADYEALRRTLSTIPGGCARGCHGERTF